MHEPIALATSFPAGSRIRLFATAMAAYASPTPWWASASSRHHLLHHDIGMM
jgi:hypothetical protein